MSELIKQYYKTKDCDNVNRLVLDLSVITREELISLICTFEQQRIEKDNIPQYSDFYKGTTLLIGFLRKSGDFGPSFEEIGKHYSNCPKKKNTYDKYGENHAKLAALLGLVVIKKEKTKRIYLTELGRGVERLSKNEQIMLLEKLAMFIPIVQYCLVNDISDRSELKNVLSTFLSKSTAARRNKNVWDLVQMARGEYIWD